jgi:transmembrane sensor
MNWLKRLRFYVRDQANTVSKRYQKGGLFKIAVRGGAAVISETLSGLLVALIFAALAILASGDPVLSGSLATRQGEYRCERLPDSSDVCLNTASVVHYNFNRNVRNVEVVSGEASFVVRNERRPFNVVGGGMLVHDLSTSFDVFKKHGSTQITVLDGRIRLVAPISNQSRLKFERAETDDAWKTAPEYHRLQQMELDEATGTLFVRPELPDWRLSQLLAWKRGRLDLTHRTLAEALDELIRYQPVTRFKYSDKSIGQIIVGGNMDFTDLDGFLASLESEFQIRHTEVGTGANTVVTLSRKR